MARIQTVQSTGKLWKFIQLVGVLAFVAGVSIACVGASSQVDLSDGLSVAAGVMAGLGLPIWFFGRVCAWWFHG